MELPKTEKKREDEEVTEDGIDGNIMRMKQGVWEFVLECVPIAWFRQSTGPPDGRYPTS